MKYLLGLLCIYFDNKNEHFDITLLLMWECLISTCYTVSIMLNFKIMERPNVLIHILKIITNYE